jgi:hypothetical protein
LSGYSVLKPLDKSQNFCLVTFFFENSAGYEIILKNIIERVRPQMKIWRMRIACWVPKVTHTQTQNTLIPVIKVFTQTDAQVIKKEY